MSQRLSRYVYYNIVLHSKYSTVAHSMLSCHGDKAKSVPETPDRDRLCKYEKTDTIDAKWMGLTKGACV